MGCYNFSVFILKEIPKVSILRCFIVWEIMRLYPLVTSYFC